MWEIEDLLVVGVAVHRRHEAVFEAEIVHHDFHDGDEAVRGARRVGDDVVLGRIVLLVIDAHHDRDVFAFGRSGNDDLLRACRAMAAGFFRFGEQAGGFNDDINTQFFPG